MSERKVAESIEILIFHCRMFRYGYRDSPEFLIDPIASLYNQFAGLHLISTMFLIKDKKREIRGGVFYRVLQPIGLEHLLAPIWEAMDLPLGSLGMAELRRKSRNSHATSFVNLAGSPGGEPYSATLVSHPALEVGFCPNQSFAWSKKAL